MALVNCPECGKEVSDTAIACPHCGFAVKDYYLENIVDENLDNNSEDNEQPSYSEGSVGKGCLGTILLFGGSIGAIALIIAAFKSAKVSYIILACIAAIVILLFSIKADSILDPKGHKKAVEENAKRQMVPDCPVCGSKNVSRISTLGRAASVEAFGVASKTIGKQYKCNTCKHMW